MRTHKAVTRIRSRRGAFRVFLTMRGESATLRLRGHASSVDYDDDEATEEFEQCPEIIEEAIRAGAKRIRIRMDATLDPACTERLVTTLEGVNRRGVSTSLSAGASSTIATQIRKVPRQVHWPSSFAEWERIVFRAGLLLSTAIAWIRYLQIKW